MKLIIDVDEKLVCEGFERHFTEEEKDTLIRSIGNGTPYKERPSITQGHWRSVGFEKGYAFCICPKCGKTIKLVRDSRNEFCCIADIREKAIACLYCGARMEN